MGAVRDATQESIDAAIADKTIDPKISAGPIAALLECAARVDGLDLDDYEARGIEVTPELLAAAMKDNVSLPTYLRLCESLRLTPASRLNMKEAKPGGSKLGQLRDANRQGGSQAGRSRQPA